MARDYDMADLAIEMKVEWPYRTPACDKLSTHATALCVGALGHTPKTASISPDVNDPGARNTSRGIAKVLRADRSAGEGGRTCCWWRHFRQLNAKAALFA